MYIKAAVLISVCQALFCPQSIHCGNLNTPTTAATGCALLIPPYVTVSTEGCNYTDNFSFCSFTELMEKYVTIVNGESLSVQCSWWNTSQIHESYKARMPDIVANATHYMQERLKTGSHPKLCDTDNDCELLTGSFARCVCSNFGHSYCSMSLGDTFMLPMYMYAGMGNELGVDYFLTYQRVYPYSSSKITCPGLFVEYQMLKEIENALRFRKTPIPYLNGGAAWMIIAVAWAFFA